MTRDVRLRREFDARPEVVFDAFTDPAAQYDLYADSPDWVVESACDLRVGGRWTIAFGAPGLEPARETNTFEEVDRPRLLVYRSTMVLADGSRMDTHVRVIFEPAGKGTQMTLIQSGFTDVARRDEFERGWTSILDALGRVAAAKAVGPTTTSTEAGADAAGIKVRRAVPGDATAIGAVFDAAVLAGWTYLGKLVAESMFTAEDWIQLVADHEPPNLLLVAVDEAGGVIGYTAVHPAVGEMFLLFVHPAHAGRGIGRRLLAAADDALRAAGCGVAFLFVHEQNERALAVYMAAGYRRDGSDRVSDFRGVRIRELRFVKDLNA